MRGTKKLTTPELESIIQKDPIDYAKLTEMLHPKPTYKYDNFVIDPPKKVPAKKAPVKKAAPKVETPAAAGEYMTLDSELKTIAGEIKKIATFAEYITRFVADVEKFPEKRPNYLNNYVEFQHVSVGVHKALQLIDKCKMSLRTGIGTQNCADTLAKYEAQAYSFLLGIPAKDINVQALEAKPMDVSKFPKCPGGCGKTFGQVRKETYGGGGVRVRESNALLCMGCANNGENGISEYVTCGVCRVADKVTNMHACVFNSNRNYCLDCINGPNHPNKCKDEDLVAPWVSRGAKIEFHKEDNEQDAATNWGFDSSKVDPVQVAADYYMLIVIRDKLYEYPRDFNGGNLLKLYPYNEEARERLKRIVEEIDPVFRGYVDMVVGGELRYHGATHAAGLRKQRHQSWNAWRRIREDQGPQALLDAALLFRRTRQGHSIGGERWAIIAETLHARVTNIITPELWLDRVFNLQHNGGIVLNKVSWKSDPHQLTKIIGPAHSRDRIDVLSWFATREVRTLMADYIRALQRARHGWGYTTKLQALPSTLWVPPKLDWMQTGHMEHCARNNLLVKTLIERHKKGIY